MRGGRSEISHRKLHLCWPVQPGMTFWRQNSVHVASGRGKRAEEALDDWIKRVWKGPDKCRTEEGMFVAGEQVLRRKQPHLPVFFLRLSH